MNLFVYKDKFVRKKTIYIDRHSARVVYKEGESYMERKKRNRVLAWLLAVALMISNLPLSVLATSEEADKIQPKAFLESVFYENEAQEMTEVRAGSASVDLTGLSQEQMEKLNLQYRIQFVEKGMTQTISEGETYAVTIPKQYFQVDDTDGAVPVYEAEGESPEVSVPIADYEVKDNQILFTLYAKEIADGEGLSAVVVIPASVKTEALTEHEKTEVSMEEARTTVLLPAKEEKVTEEQTGESAETAPGQNEEIKPEESDGETAEQRPEESQNVTPEEKAEKAPEQTAEKEKEAKGETASEEKQAEPEKENFLSRMIQTGKSKIAGFFRLFSQDTKETAEYATSTKHIFTSDELPEGFQKIAAEVKSKAGGYSQSTTNNVAGFSYEVYLDDGVLYDRSMELMDEPGFPREGADYNQWMDEIEVWFEKNPEMRDKYYMEYEYQLGDYFKSFDGEPVEVSVDGVKAAQCQIAGGKLTVTVLPFCFFMDSVSFKFALTAKIDNDKLEKDPQEVIIDDKGELLFQSVGTAGGGSGDTEEPKYTVEKTAPAQVKETVISYDIHVEASEGEVLNGKTLEDAVPTGLEVQLAYVKLNGSDEEILLYQNLPEKTYAGVEYKDGLFAYTFEPLISGEGEDTNAVTSADFQIVMGLTIEKYNQFTKANGIDETFRNKAVLTGDEPEKKLAESEEVSTDMKAQFISKSGKAENLEGSRWLWTINVSTQLPSLDYGYLVDTLCWTDHTYDFKEGIHVQAGKESYTIKNVKEIKFDTAWKDLTADGLKALVNADEFDQDHPTAYYYFVDEGVLNPFYQAGTDEPQNKQRAILIIPYKNLQGSAGESKKVTVKYSTDLNMHGLSAEEYWAKLQEKDAAQPSINNLVKLLWKNKDGIGPVPPTDWVDIGKEPQPHPGSVAKRGISYDPKTQLLTWEIDVNKIGISMKDIELKDFLPDGAYAIEDALDIKWYQYEMKTSKEIANGTLATEKDKSGRSYSVASSTKDDGTKGKEITISLGTTDIETASDGTTAPSFYKLRFTLKLTDKVLAVQSKDQTVGNKVTLSYYEGDTPNGSEAEGDIKVPNTLIEKEKDGAYNYYTHELPWKVTINPNGLPIADAKITDVLEKDFEFGQVTKVVYDGTEDKAADLDNLKNQTKDPNFNKTNPVFDIGEIDAPYTVYFTTVATEQWRDKNLKGADNKSFTIPNTAILGGRIYENTINSAKARDDASNVIEKTLIGKSGVYDNKEESITWTLDLNKEQYNIAGMHLEERLLIPDGKKNPIHELDPDSIKIYRIGADGEPQGEDVTDTDGKFLPLDEVDTPNMNGFSYEFKDTDGTGDEEVNRHAYRITFKTLLNENAEGARISNKVYLKDQDDKQDNKSADSNGGYDGSFGSSQESSAKKRPRIEILKISSNTDDIAEDKDKLALEDVEFTLSTHEFEYKDDGTLTIGKEVERYKKQCLSGAEGTLLFSNIKTSQGLDGSQDNDLICVLEEQRTKDGYVKKEDKYFVYFSGNGTGTSLITKDVTAIQDEDGNALVASNQVTDHFLHNTDSNAASSIVIKNEPQSLNFSFTKKEVKLDSYMDKGTPESEYVEAADVKFTITPLGALAGKVDTQEVTSDENGEVALPNLDEGRYLLTEVEATPGQMKGSVEFTVDWKDDNSKYDVVFEKATVKNMVISEDGKTLSDQLNTSGAVSFTKKVGYETGAGGAVVQNNEEPLAGAAFRLVSVKPEGNQPGVGENNVEKIVKSNANGVVQFKDLPIGKYEIYECYDQQNMDVNLSGYVKNGVEEKVYDLEISETEQEGGTTAVLTAKLTTVRTKTDLEKQDTDEIIYNQPVTGTITFKKKISESDLTAFNDKSLAGVEFGLFRKIGTDVANTAIQTAESDDDGKVMFSGVEYGDYVLKETATPEGYVTIAPIDITKEMLRSSGISNDGFTYSHPDIANTLYKTIVDFTKKDKDGNLLPGIEFDVYRRGSGIVNADGSTGTPLDSQPMDLVVGDDMNTYYRYCPEGTEGVVTTDQNGKFALSNVPIGEYLLVEKTSVENFQDGYGHKAIYVSVTENKVYEKEDIRDSKTEGINDCYTVSDVSDAQDWNENTDHVIFNYKKYGFVNLHKVEAEQNYKDGKEEMLNADPEHPLEKAKFGIYYANPDGTMGDLYLTLETDKKGEFSYGTDGKDSYYIDAKTKETKHLWYGDYILKELEAPAGHAVNETAIPFHIGEGKIAGSQVEYAGHEGTVWISLNKETSDVRYVKQKGDTPEAKDFSFANRVKRGWIQVKKVSSENETAFLSDAEFDVKTDGKIVAHLAELDKVNAKGIYKLTDLTGEEKADNTNYAVKNAAEIPYLYKTDDGYMLLEGSYQLVETKAPSGYQLDGKAISLEVSDQKTAEKTITNEPLAVKIQKTDDTGSYNLTGAEFTVMGTFVTDPKGTTETKTVSITENQPITGLIAGETYTLAETKAPDGYILYTEPVKFKVNEDRTLELTGTVDKDRISLDTDKRELSMKNDPIHLQIVKECGGEPLEEATEFELYQGAAYLGKLTTDEKGTLKIQRDPSKDAKDDIYLTGGETYCLKESKAAPGYVTPKDNQVLFTVGTDGVFSIKTEEGSNSLGAVLTSQKMVIQNEKTVVKIQKTDTDGTIIPGGTFAVYEEGNETAVDTWTNDETDTNPHVITGKIVEGRTYELRELTRPDGYLLEADPIAFTVQNGVLVESDHVITQDGAKILQMQDKQVLRDISLVKTYDSAPKDEIAGVAFDLTVLDEKNEEQKTPFASGKTNENGSLTFTDVPEGRYRIRENLADSEAVDDVYIDEAWYVDVEVGVNENQTQMVLRYLDGEEITGAVPVGNERFAASVKLVKQDPEDYTPLEGVQFLLERKNGDDYTPYGDSGAVYATDRNGVLQIGHLVKGDYRLTESDTIYGYLMDGKAPFRAEFTVGNAEHGSIIWITEENAGKKWNLDIVSGAELLKGEVLTNTRAAGTVTIQKADGVDNTIGLNGAEFALYQKKDGNWFENTWNFITGKQYDVVENIEGSEISKEGQLIIGGLEWGTYKLKETKAPAGYQNDNVEYEFQIGRDGTTITLAVDGKEIVNYPNEIVLEKRGSNLPNGNALLDGAEFTITNKNNAEDVQHVTVKDGRVTLTKHHVTDGDYQFVGGETYLLHETKAPDGYEFAEDVVFTMGEDGRIRIGGQVMDSNVIAVTDNPTHIEFRKEGKINETCSDNPDAAVPLAGVEFTAYNVDTPDTAAASAVSDADGLVVFEGLSAGTYWIQETKAAPGYQLHAEKYMAEVSSQAGSFKGLQDDEGNLLKDNTVMNDVYRTDIRLKKVNEQNPAEAIPNGEYGLFRQDQSGSLQMIKTAVTDGEGLLEFKGVLMDTEYTIQELEAPDGSYVSEHPIQISFKVENGKVMLDDFKGGNGTASVDETTGEITWYEPSVEYAFLKTNADGTEVLEGTQFELRAEDGTVVEEWISGKEAYVSSRKLMAGETYTLAETKAPDGYGIADAVTFTVPDEKAGPGEKVPIAVTMKDEPTEFRIIKTAAETGEELTGSGFAVTGRFADGKEVQTKMLKPGTDEDSLKGILNVGEKYVLTETKSPDGYARYQSEVGFWVNEDRTLTLDKSTEPHVVELGGDQMTIIFQNRQMSIDIFKKCGDDPVKGVTTFKLYRETENQQKQFLEELKTDDSGELTITKKYLITGSVYYLEEVNAAPGYVTPKADACMTVFKVLDDGALELIPADNPLDVTLVQNGKGLIIQNVMTTVQVQKTDENDKPLSGGTFAVYEKDSEEAVERWTNDGTPHVIVGKLVEGRTYELREETRPDNYLKADPVEFTLEKGAEITYVTMRDEQVLKDIKLVKTYENSQKTIEGVAFDLISSTGIKTKKTDENGVLVFEDVPEGSYQIRENLEQSTAADDVWINEDWSVDVEVTADENDETKAVLKADGEVVRDVIAVTNERFAASVSLTKKDPEDGTPLAGVTFLLEKKNGEACEPYVPAGNVNGEYRTDIHGVLQIADLAKGSYRLTEVQTVYGYTLEKPFEAAFTLTNDHQGNEVRITQDNVKAGKWNLEIEKGSGLLVKDVLTNTRATGSMTLWKADGTDHTGLNGTVFELLKKKDDGLFANLWNFITGKQYDVLESLDGEDLEEQGRLTIHGLEWGTYKLVETKPSEGYKNEGAEYEFTIGRVGTEVTLEADGETIVNLPNELVIEKRGSDLPAGDNLLDGAVFTITNRSDESDVQTVNVTGGRVTLIKQLVGGRTYVLHEKTAPEGYELNAEDVVFKMGEDGQVSIGGVPAADNVICVTDKPTHIAFQKAGKINESCSDVNLGGADPDAFVPLEGAEFTAYRKDAPEQAEAVAVSDKDGVVSFDGLPAGTYLIKETKAPEGYRIDSAVYEAEVSDIPGTFEGLKDAEGNLLKDNTVINDVYRTNIVFTKVNEQNTDEVLPGSVYGLYKRVDQDTRRKSSDIEMEGLQLIAKATTDENGLLKFEGVLMNTEYVIRELEAPDGSYVSQNPITIAYVVGRDGKPEISHFDGGDGTSKLDEITGEIIWYEPSVEIEFQKTDLEGTPVAGAVLQILDKDGSVVDEWISGETPHLSHRELVIGETYELTEISAPDGYLKAEPISFTVDDGRVGPGENKRELIVMKDAPTFLKILKTAEGTKEVLTGAEFEIKGTFADGSKVQTVKPGKDGAVLKALLIAGNEYQMAETKAPEGYETLENPVVFTVNEQGRPELGKADGRVSLTELEEGYQIDIANKKKPEEIVPDSQDGNSDKTAQQKPGKGAKTGDESKMFQFGILAIVSGVAAGTTRMRRKKRRR